MSRVAFLILCLGVFFMMYLTVTYEPKPGKQVALVKIENTIYHCERVTVNECGTNVKCGQFIKYCMTEDIEVQWL